MACEICGADGATQHKDVLNQDHDHETGFCRGMICFACNRAIGCVRDNPVILRAAADYLERYAANPTGILYVDYKRTSYNLVNRAWRALHRERVNAQQRARRAANPEQYRAYGNRAYHKRIGQ
jgi:hypothetical protein